MRKKILRNEKDTEKFGKRIARALRGGEVLTFKGPLGAGKTTLIRAIARTLGVKKNIASPTFTLMNIYKIKNLKLKIKNFVHIDAYRLKSGKELKDIGAREYMNDPHTVVAIEWPERVRAALKGIACTALTLAYHGNGRKINWK